MRDDQRSNADELSRLRRLERLGSRLRQSLTGRDVYSATAGVADAELILESISEALQFRKAILTVVTDEHGGFVSPRAYSDIGLEGLCCVWLAAWGFGNTSTTFINVDASVYPIRLCGGLTRVLIEQKICVQVFDDDDWVRTLETQNGLRSATRESILAVLDDMQSHIVGAKHGAEQAEWLARIATWRAEELAAPETESFLEQRRRFYRTGAPYMGDPSDFADFGDYVRYLLIPVLRNHQGEEQLVAWLQFQSPIDLSPDHPVNEDMLARAREIVEYVAVLVDHSWRSHHLMRSLENERKMRHDLVSAQDRLVAERDRAARAEQTELLAGQMAHEVRGEISPLLMALDTVQSGLPDPTSYTALEQATVEAYNASRTDEDRRRLQQAARVLKELTPDGPIAQQVRALRGIGSRISELVEGVMDYARLGKDLGPAREEVDLAAVVRQVAASFGPARVVVSQADAAVLSGHDLRLRQALRNLVQNGVDATEDAEAQLSRPYQPVELELEATGTEYRIAVRDHGIGIEQERLATIFTPMLTTKPTKGHGLGLVTAQRIVEAHGGEIVVDSHSAVGTSFLVRFPRGGGTKADE